MISAAIERCAGIDVGKKFLAVCVMVGPLEGEPRVDSEVRYDPSGIGRVARLAEATRSHPCGDGKHRLVLEARV